MILPVFVFDSRESFWPIGVEDSLAATKAKLPRSFTSEAEASSTDRIDFPAGMRHPVLPPVAYHRVLADRHLWWHQLWLWFVYNPWEIAGVGKHEGDWELVQIGCADKAGNRPVLVTGSQHHTGGKHEFWACQLRGGRPVIYVARGSHANYFSLGAQGGLDVCDGKGLLLEDYEVREFGAWASWPGRWGNSTGEGKSPESPGCQGIRWRAPAAYHATARS